ncbi:MAG: hypothetical protein ABJA50_06170 [Chloroflexota bacterium]
MRNDDPLISEVEDLDPDPTPGKGRLDVRELLLGCLLLMMTLGWAGLQWWQQGSKESRYRMGQEAEKESRWSEARSDYAAASDYRDATTRAASVTKVINELQDNFVSARWHAQEGDWAAALRAVQAVHAIDPHYGDVGSLGVEANLHVYQEALQGAVAMRPQAQPPGLYYRTGETWVWLEGSDQWSSVRSLLSSGVIVYDVPAENRVGHSTPTPTPLVSTSSDPRQDTEWLKGRRLLAASPDGDKPRFTILAFDPAMYDFYIAGEGVVWGVRSSAAAAGEQPPGGQPAVRDHQSFPVGREWDYQRLSGTISSTVRLPGTEWVVLNADSGHDRLLLADIRAQRSGSAAVDLYISDVGGDNRRLLYSHEGALGSTLFSPAGRYVLVSTYSPLGGSRTEKLSLVLLDLQNSAPPLTVGAKVIAASGPGSSPFPRMRATFLLEGTWAGMLLVAEWGTEHGTLSLFDPAKPESPMLRVEIPGGIAGKAWAVEQEDGAELVVAWQSWLSGFSTKDAPLVVTILAPGKPVVTKTFTLNKDSEALSVVLRGDYLICTAYRAAEGSAAAQVTVYSFPLPGPSNGEEKGIELYNSRAWHSSNFFLSGFDWQLGPKLLSYSENGQLHARTYDGVIDVTLESAVTDFFDFDWLSPLRLLH